MNVMKDITQNVIRGEILEVVGIEGIYSKASRSENQQPDYIRYVNPAYSVVNHSKKIEWLYNYKCGVMAKYESQQSMVYGWINNTQEIGVNSVVVDLQQMEKTAPILLSSGTLSGCMVLCLYFCNGDHRFIIFAHAGNGLPSGLQKMKLRESYSQQLYSTVLNLLQEEIPEFQLPQNNTDAITNHIDLSNKLLAIPGVMRASLMFSGNDQSGQVFENGGQRRVTYFSYDAQNSIFGASYCLINQSDSKLSVNMAGGCYQSNEQSVLLPTSDSFSFTLVI